MVAGLGVADAFEREVSLEQDSAGIASLFRDALVFTLAFCVVIALALWACAPVIERVLTLQGVASALTIAGLAILTERTWQLTSALVRRVSGAGAYLRLLVANASVGLVSAIAGVVAFGVDGFFHALWFTSGVSCALAWLVTRRHLSQVLGKIGSAWMVNMRRLWRLSWASFSYKATTIVWRRIPLVVCSGLLEERQLGAISVAMDLTWKLHILQQALSPLAVSRLAPIFRQRLPQYRSAALREATRSRALDRFSPDRSCGGMGVWRLAGCGIRAVGRNPLLVLRSVSCGRYPLFCQCSICVDPSPGRGTIKSKHACNSRSAAYPLCRAAPSRTSPPTKRQLSLPS